MCKIFYLNWIKKRHNHMEAFRSLGFSDIASYLKGKLQFNNNCWMNVSILSRSFQPSKGETRYSLFIPSVALDDGDQYFSPL